eukprot:Gb_41004 [translate_table: standard]
MQAVGVCGVRFTYLNSLRYGHDEFGLSKTSISWKNGRFCVDVAKDLSLQLRSSPSHLYGSSRPSWPVAVSTQDETNTGDRHETAVPEDTTHSLNEQGPLVQVQFVLEKKCRFGQQFYVIGDDPQFGTWDPKAALPLEWSEGDIWTKEVDVPVGKQIEYKFILIGKRGELLWQPGPNRTFETLESDSPMVVSSTWESDEKFTLEDENDQKAFDTASVETEEGIKDEISDSKVGEGSSPLVESAEGASTLERGDAISDTLNGVLGLTSPKNTGNLSGKDSAVDISGAADTIGVSNGDCERGAASTTEAI